MLTSPLLPGCRFRVEHWRSTGLQGKTYEQGVKETRDFVPFFDFPNACRTLNIAIQCIKSENMAWKVVGRVGYPPVRSANMKYLGGKSCAALRPLESADLSTQL